MSEVVNTQGTYLRQSNSGADELAQLVDFCKSREVAVTGLVFSDQFCHVWKPCHEMEGE